MQKRARGRGRVDPLNKRLDEFLSKLQIEQEKRQQILQYVEQLTFETVNPKKTPQLRLSKFS